MLDRTQKPSLGPAPSFSFPSIERRPLATGLEVWTVERADVPVAALAVLIPAGSASDPDERPGLTALAADLLDEGTTTRSALQLHEELQGLGAELDIDVSPDTTVVSLLTLARHFEQAAELLADVVRQPAFAADDFTRVRELRLNRLRQLRDVPSALADRAFARDLFGTHPYAHTPLGTEESLTAATREDVAAQHRRSLAARGAHVVVVGAVDGVRVHRSLPAFQPVSSSVGQDMLPAVPDATPPRQPHRLVLVDRPGAVQSEIRVGRLAVSRRTPHYFPLVVANAILGGQFVSRLNTNLRETKGYTYGVRSAFDFRKSTGPFVVATSVQTDATADTICEILRECDEMGGARPATPEELNRAKAALTRGYPRGFETAEQVARGALMLATHDLPLDYFSRFAERVTAVGIADVTEVARWIWNPADLRITIVGDATKVGSALDAAGFSERLLLDPAGV